MPQEAWLNISQWILGGLCTIILTGGGWVLASVVKGVEENRKEIGGYKQHVAENYATKNDVILVRTEMNQSLGRIHERIDESNKKNEENFKELRDGTTKILERLIDIKKT